MKVQILVSTIANKALVLKGQIVDLPEEESRSLVSMGRAIFFKEIPAKIEDVSKEHGELLELSSEEKPKRKSKNKRENEHESR